MIPHTAYRRHLEPPEVQEFETLATVELTLHVRFESAVQDHPDPYTVEQRINDEITHKARQVVTDMKRRLDRPNMPTLDVPPYKIEGLEFETVHDQHTMLGSRG